MSGIGSTLSIARTAIASQQYGLAVTGNNIANVNNPDYSLQNAEQISRMPALYAGFLFGTGVDTQQIEQSVDNFLEQRLTNEQSNQAAFEEAESYIRILEGYFDENSEAGITSMLNEFWSSWHDLSNNPLGSSERVAVYENAENLAARFNQANEDLADLTGDINQEINSTLGQVNALSEQIAELNVQIVAMEGNRSANDLRDQRNSLVDELGTLIDIDVFEEDDGSLLINIIKGLPLVNKEDSYDLYFHKGDIIWEGSYGGDIDITDRISGGKLAGWLEIRDEVIPKVSQDLDTLAREMVWAINYQHSQGAGLEYYTGILTGSYRADESGLLSSYAFGDQIDYTRDLTVWMQDSSSSDTGYTRTRMDMGISGASISNWTGSASGFLQYRYELTVMDSAVIGDRQVAETDGVGLAEVVSSATDVTAALDAAIVSQTITVDNGPSGTERIDIQDAGGQASRSADAIALAFSGMDGVEAYASEVSAAFDPSAMGPDLEDGDTVRFTLYVGGSLYEQSFVVDSAQGSIDEQFENALWDAADQINTFNNDLDLYADGLTLTSSSGKTLGVQDFQVQDNAGVSLNAFTGFAAGDTVTLTVNAGGTDTDISFTLASDLDTTDQAEMASLFYDELSGALADNDSVSVAHDPWTNTVVLRTTDGSALNFVNAANTTNPGAQITATELGGTLAAGDNTLSFNGDTENFSPDAQDSGTLGFSGQGMSAVLGENGFNGTNAGALTGTVTLITEPGMTVFSDVAGAGGIFSSNWAPVGSSIVTLGGEGGFGGFDAGDTIRFDLDGTPVSFVVGGTDDIDLATDLETALNTSLGASEDYRIIRTGTSVSVLKDTDLDDPIEITNFSDNTGSDATLAVNTGSGAGTSDPENDLLDAGNPDRNSSTASLYADSGIIRWKKYDEDNIFTGDEGLIHVDDSGTYAIVEGGGATLTFDLSEGSLVAGNTLTINTDEDGEPDLLDMEIYGRANNKNAIYTFTVTTGGEIGEPVADEDTETITIEWKNGTDSGSFEIDAPHEPLKPGVPIEVEVDGMTLKFFDGFLFEDDVFTITTDADGKPVAENSDGNPTGEVMSDWHWTQESFVSEFNRQAEGLTASVTSENRLQFQASESYHALTDVEYSAVSGFDEKNVSINVLDWSALGFGVEDLQFSRSADGDWGISNDPTGGQAVLLPVTGDDDGFGIDFSGDGLADIEVRFAQKPTGEGWIRFDLEERSANDIGFAFGDDSTEGSSGLLAAAGINTFFDGFDALTMGVDSRMADTQYVAASTINGLTGEISQGDNTNALALAEVQYQDIVMRQWDYTRGADPASSLTTTTLDGYYATMMGSLGITSRSIQSSKEFADIMVNNLTEQRNAVSAVSLDEEMIKLMEYQHAFSAASKLVSVADEMLQTLISMR